MRACRAKWRPSTAWLPVAAMTAFLLAPSRAAAQQAGTREVPEVGDVAPEFELAGATRYGVLRAPVRLSDFRGKTVVLAFFFQARTPG